MKKHYALYRDGLLLIRTKTYTKAIKVQNEFIHTGKTFEIKEEEHVTPWAYGTADGHLRETRRIV